MSSESVTLDRLEEQIGWYDAKSKTNQTWFKSLKIAELILAGSVPVLAGLSVNNIVTAIVGALVVALESVLQLNQFHQNWLIYRSTCEDLKHEKYLYSAKAAVYSTASDPAKLLAERLESLISKEHAKWVSSQEDSKNKKGQEGVS